MKKIVTIGGWNGQSNLLDALYCNIWSEVHITSIVSMSDDGRTTGTLMRAFKDELDLHLPPPWDLRRCLFSLSSSFLRDDFKSVFESVFSIDKPISHFCIWDLFKKYSTEKLFEYMKNNFSDIFEFQLPLNSTLQGHKFWNILMASLYFNLNKDYDMMIKYMHNILEVKSDVVPVTTSRALIKAVLWNGDIIETQDRISNVASYNSGIADLELMDCSKDATHNKKVHDALVGTDFIIIWPGDLFTSIISNFIIAGMKESLTVSKAQIIFIWNSTNKWGETNGLTHIDFINKVEMFLGKRINYFISNNKKPELSHEEYKMFQKDISVKWGDYLFLSQWERLELLRRKVIIKEENLLSADSFYKQDKKKIAEVIQSIINN